MTFKVLECVAVTYFNMDWFLVKVFFEKAKFIKKLKSFNIEMDCRFLFQCPWTMFTQE